MEPAGDRGPGGDQEQRQPSEGLAATNRRAPLAFQRGTVGRMDRVHLHRVFGTDRQRRWRQGAVAAFDTTEVTFGRLSDGRWFADRAGYEADADDRQQGACVFGTDEQGRQLALRWAYSWMRGGDWRPQPARFDGSGRPADGLPWLRTGQDWYLKAQPSSDAADDG